MGWVLRGEIGAKLVTVKGLDRAVTSSVTSEFPLLEAKEVNKWLYFQLVTQGGYQSYQSYQF